MRSIVTSLSTRFGNHPSKPQTQKTVFQLTTGNGPDECSWVLEQTFLALKQDAQKHQLQVLPLFENRNRKNNLLQSLIFDVNGQDPMAFMKSWLGSIRWIGQSKQRAGHKRHSWFVAIKPIQLKDIPKLDPEAVEIQATRASGPGGQKVNKTASAIRVSHIPTGIHIKAQDQRSQTQNRKAALERLKDKLDALVQEAKASSKQSQREQARQLMRTKPVRTYEGDSFRLVRIHESQ
jgi:peptide chain release factor